MLTFFFWNVNGEPLEQTVASFAREHEIDVIMLAESPTPPGRVLETLNESETRYHFTFSTCDALPIYTRFSQGYIGVIYEEARLTIRQLRLPGQDPLLLAVYHGVSKLHTSEQSQQQGAVKLAQTIRRVEEEQGHSRTVLVGDLNMNPFEPGVIGAGGLHAVMTRERANQMARVVQGERCPFFYNPGWGSFGDSSAGPPGTYHYSRGEHVTYFWNMFDQVLLRPELLRCFPMDGFQILTRTGDASLLSARGIPAQREFSDHLPILFRLLI